MLGAIAGDIIGSRHENSSVPPADFDLFGDRCRFTDDTVCTIAIADCFLSGGNFGELLGTYALRYPKRGYGSFFEAWAKSWDRKPYGSLGNGAAMRVSPVGFSARSRAQCDELSTMTALPTHNHPDAIRCANAVAATIWMSRHGEAPDRIAANIADDYRIQVDQSLEAMRATQKDDVSALSTVPNAIAVALQSSGFEDAVRAAVSLGGDADTIASIAGAIAEAMHGVPNWITEAALDYLPPAFRGLISDFYAAVEDPGRFDFEGLVARNGGFIG